MSSFTERTVARNLQELDHEIKQWSALRLVAIINEDGRLLQRAFRHEREARRQVLRWRKILDNLRRQQMITERPGRERAEAS